MLACQHWPTPPLQGTPSPLLHQEQGPTPPLCPAPSCLRSCPLSAVYVLLPLHAMAPSLKGPAHSGPCMSPPPCFCSFPPQDEQPTQGSVRTLPPAQILAVSSLPRVQYETIRVPARSYLESLPQTAYQGCVGARLCAEGRSGCRCGYGCRCGCGCVNVLVWGCDFKGAAAVALKGPSAALQQSQGLQLRLVHGAKIQQLRA